MDIRYVFRLFPNGRFEISLYPILESKIIDVLFKAIMQKQFPDQEIYVPDRFVAPVEAYEKIESNAILRRLLLKVEKNIRVKFPRFKIIGFNLQEKNSFMFTRKGTLYHVEIHVYGRSE